jgi:hypothetical protein
MFISFCCSNASRWARIGFFSLLLCFCVGARAESALQPAEVLELSLKAMVNLDIQSATKINDYLRPTGGQDIFNLQSILEMGNYATLQEAPAEREAPDQIKEADLKEAERRLFKAMLGAARRSSCRATTNELEEDAETSGRIAQVGYVCVIPAARIQAALSALEKALKSDPEQGLALMNNIVAELARAPTERNVTGVVSLRETKIGAISYWRPVDIDDAFALIMRVLTSE